MLQYFEIDCEEVLTEKLVGTSINLAIESVATVKKIAVLEVREVQNNEDNDNEKTLLN